MTTEFQSRTWCLPSSQRITLLMWGRDFQYFSTPKMRLKVSSVGSIFWVDCKLLTTHTPLARSQLPYLEEEPKVSAWSHLRVGCLTTGIDPLELSLSRTTPAHHAAQANEVPEPTLHLCQQDSHALLATVMHSSGPMVAGCWNTLHWKTRTVSISRWASYELCVQLSG